FCECFSINTPIGSDLLSGCVLLTCLSGLKKTVNILGSIGHAIVLFVSVIGITAILNAQMDLKSGSEFLVTKGSTLQPSNNWLIASLMFFSFCTLFRGPYSIGSAIHRNEPIKIVVWGNIIGMALYGILGFILMAGQIMNASLVDDNEVRNLTLGLMISQVIGVILLLVRILAVFTTATPLIWSVSDIVTKEDSKFY